jgi:hypothetical protein
MSQPQPRDYADSGLTIQAAMLDHVKRFPDKRSRPSHILWAGRCVRTGDDLTVPRLGTVRGEFLLAKNDLAQGFDIKVSGGGLILPSGKKVELLRTWNGADLDPVVTYPFESPRGILHVWNVYKMRYEGGREVEERWTGNAGFWVEVLSECDRVYHASHGAADPPDFESLVFRMTVSTRSSAVM